MNNLIFLGFLYKILKKRDFFSKTPGGDLSKRKGNKVIYLYNYKYFCLNNNLNNLIFFFKLYSLLSNLKEIKNKIIKNGYN